MFVEINLFFLQSSKFRTKDKKPSIFYSPLRKTFAPNQLKYSPNRNQLIPFRK